MFCSKCQKNSTKDTKFCIFCGLKFTVNYYNLLGISQNATDEEIKIAFRKLVHQYHPDKNNGDDKKFKEINNAYQILSDKYKRKDYDSSLEKESKPDSETNKNDFKDTNQTNNSETTHNSENTINNEEWNIQEKIIAAVVIFGVILTIGLIGDNKINNNSDLSTDNTTTTSVYSTKKEDIYLTLGGIPIQHDSFSMKFDWYTYGETLESNEVVFENSYLENPHTNGTFAIMFLSVKNEGLEKRSIYLNNFSFKDDVGREYKPYYSYTKYSNTKKAVYSYDEKRKKVYLSSDLILDIEEKIAILFEVSKETKAGNLMVLYNN